MKANSNQELSMTTAAKSSTFADDPGDSSPLTPLGKFASGPEPTLPHWQPNIFRKGDHFAITITAPREQGKSTLFRDIFTKCDFTNLFDVHMLFSKTLDMNFFGEFFPGDGRLMYKGFEPEKLQRVIVKADEFYSQHKRYLDILIVFDDCIGSSSGQDAKQIKNENSIMELFTIGRHKGISVIFLTQAPSLINKSWRTNTNLSILLYSPDANDAEHMYNNALAGVDMRNAKWSDGSSIVIPANYKSVSWVGPPKKKFMLDLYERTCRDYWAIIINTKPGCQQPISRYRSEMVLDSDKSSLKASCSSQSIKSCLKKVVSFADGC